MKFLLTIFICSVAGEIVRPTQDYPKVFDDHYDCIRAGLSESYEDFICRKNFTQEQINNLQLYPKFTCSPVEDEGKIPHKLSARPKKGTNKQKV